MTNLPYDKQDEFAARLVKLGARDGCSVALLARAEWIVAQARRELIHRNPNFAGVLVLPSRPEWVRPTTASPRHNFSWYVWVPTPRAPGVDAWTRFAESKEAYCGQSRIRSDSPHARFSACIMRLHFTTRR